MRVLFAVLLEAVLLNISPLRLWERALVHVGLCGYSIYLFHIPLLGAGTRYLTKVGWDLRSLGLWFLAAVILFAPILLFSWISYQVL